MALLLVIAWPWPASAQTGSSTARIVIEGAKTTWDTPLDSATGLAIPYSQVRSRLLVESAASSRSEIVRQIPDSLPDLDLRIRVEHSATAFRQDMSDSAEVIEGTAGVTPRLVIERAGATMLLPDLSVERGPDPATVGGRVLVERAAVSGIQAMALPVRTPPPAPPAATAVTQPAQPAPHEQPAPGESHPTPIPVAQPIEITRPLWPWFAVGAAAITVAAIAVLLIVRRRKGLRPRSHREPPQIDPRGDDQ
jgi:hypothetical protein